MLEDLLAHVPVDDAAKIDVVERMSGPDRRYHNVEHLAVLWRRHVRYAADARLESAEAHRLIACATAYHDIVYDSHRGDNEAMSRAVWLDQAARTNLDPGDVLWVADTISATHDHLAYEPASDSLWERLRLWFLDLDLTPLAEPPARFLENAELLRQEAAHLSYAVWDAGRVAFLRKIAAAPRIYRSPILFRRYEAQARENIAGVLRAT